MSCAFATSAQSHEHARIAEELGFRRAYFYDSPGLYADVWMQLARAADRTERIGLGPAVLVPSNRHVVTNAAAILTLVDIIGAPRVSVALGSGRTARLALGQRPLRWAAVADYIRVLRGLLRGDTEEWEGQAIRLLHGPGFGPARPVEIEILIAAAGPKGLAVAAELGDGAFGGTAPVAGFDRSPCLAWGTVLEPGEEPDNERVLAMAGPAAAVFAGHYPIELGQPESDSEFTARWRRAYADIEAGHRHLELHTGHLTQLTVRDRPFVTGDLLTRLRLAGSREVWLEQLADLEARGASEVVFQPAGPDLPAQLAMFADLFQ